MKTVTLDEFHAAMKAQGKARMEDVRSTAVSAVTPLRTVATGSPMPTAEQVIAVFETSPLCDRCAYFIWGPGGPDPCECRAIRGDRGTELTDCPGVDDQN